MQTREIQGKLWSTAPEDWAKFLEPTFIPMYYAALHELDLDKNSMVLDAGCGSGLFLSMAARSGASTFGIDAAPGLLEIAKKRLPDTPLLIEDLESIPFASNTFDVVTGFNSFQFAGSFQNALAEARRVVKSDGMVVIGIWGREEDFEAGTVLNAVNSLLPPPSPGTPGPYALSENGALEAMCNTIGLKVVLKQTVSCPWQFSGLEEMLAGFMCTAPCVKAAGAVGELRVRKTIARSAEPYRLTDGVYFMRNNFTFYITEKI